MQTLIVFKQSN